MVRLSAIGDVVHTLPVLDALHGAGWATSWLVEPPARPLLENGPVPVRIVAPPSRRRFSWRQALAALRALRAQPCDVAFDFQGLWKSALWARASGAARVVGWAGAGRREPGSALLLRETRPAPSDGHVIDRNLALLGAVGVQASGHRSFPLPRPAEVVTAVDETLARLRLTGGEVVILNPGGGWDSKLWPAEAFGALARELRQDGLACVVTWGPGEEVLADRVVAAADGAAVRCESTTLLEFTELARRVRLVVAADTGPLHLACAVGTPVVALFGPTDPARNGPFDPKDRVLRATPPCAPCHRRSCAIHGGIMADIAPADVAGAVRERLARVERSA